MIVARREALRLLAGGVATVAVHDGSLAAPISGKQVLAKKFPSFELQGTAASLASLGTDVAAFSPVRSGTAISAVWLKGKDGIERFVGVDHREPMAMFEVFTLSIATIEELEARWRDWTPPKLPDGWPEPFRTLAMTRPAAPTPPADFEPWPFDRWQTQVLRRAEFIVEDVPAVATVGNNPNMQSAARPNNIPHEASAVCEVAAGVLFTGANDERFLIGIDWMPSTMVVTKTAANIDNYLHPCEIIDLTAYLARRAKRA